MDTFKYEKCVGPCNSSPFHFSNITIGNSLQCDSWNAYYLYKTDTCLKHVWEDAIDMRYHRKLNFWWIVEVGVNMRCLNQAFEEQKIACILLTKLSHFFALCLRARGMPCSLEWCSCIKELRSSSIGWFTNIKNLCYIFRRISFPTRVRDNACDVGK